MFAFSVVFPIFAFCLLAYVLGSLIDRRYPILRKIFQKRAFVAKALSFACNMDWDTFDSPVVPRQPAPPTGRDVDDASRDKEEAPRIMIKNVKNLGTVSVIFYSWNHLPYRLVVHTAEVGVKDLATIVREKIDPLPSNDVYNIVSGRRRCNMVVREVLGPKGYWAEDMHDNVLWYIFTAIEKDDTVLVGSGTDHDHDDPEPAVDEIFVYGTRYEYHIDLLRTKITLKEALTKA